MSGRDAGAARRAMSELSPLAQWVLAALEKGPEPAAAT